MQHQSVKERSEKPGLQPVSTITLPVGSLITQDELLEVLTAFPKVREVNGFKWNNHATIKFKDLDIVHRLGIPHKCVKVSSYDV